MTTIVVVVSVFTIGVAVLGVAAPSRISDMVRLARLPGVLYLAAAGRVAFGVVLIMVAEASKAPGAFRVVGGLVLAVGIAMPFLARERTDAFIDWWLGLPAWMVRVWCAFAGLLGAFLLYGVAP